MELVLKEAVLGVTEEEIALMDAVIGVIVEDILRVDMFVEEIGANDCVDI